MVKSVLCIWVNFCVPTFLGARNKNGIKNEYWIIRKIRTYETTFGQAV